MSASPTWTVGGVREALLTKKISARELAKDFYARIERRNPELNAFLALCPERAYTPCRPRRRGHRQRASPCRPWPAFPSRSRT